MPSLKVLRSVLPSNVVDSAMLEDVAARWLGADERTAEKFLRLARNAGVERRFLVQPYDETLSLGGLEERAALFERHGVALLSRALEKALSDYGEDSGSLSHFLFTSCSVPLIPSIDAPVILGSSIPPSISRVPIFQSGCAGGVVALSLGSKLASLGRPVVVSSVELCSLVFQPRNLSGEQLVGAAIFGDGAACGIISPEPGGLQIEDSVSCLIPGTRHLMGYDIRDDGLHLRLDRELPSSLAEYAPSIIGTFLAKHGLSPDAIDYWLFHPGGKRILELFSERFGIEHSQCRWSWDVLRECGNLSSATILLVLERFMESGALSEGQTALVVGIGPGLTVELVLLRG